MSIYYVEYYISFSSGPEFTFYPTFLTVKIKPQYKQPLTLISNMYIRILTAGDKNAYVTWSSNNTGNVEIMFSMKITRERLFLIALIATTILAIVVAPFLVH